MSSSSMPNDDQLARVAKNQEYSRNADKCREPDSQELLIACSTISRYPQRLDAALSEPKMTGLPDEILINMVQHIDHNQALLCLSLVCQRIRTVAQAELFRIMSINHVSKLIQLSRSLLNIPDLASKVKVLAIDDLKPHFEKSNGNIMLQTLKHEAPLDQWARELLELALSGTTAYVISLVILQLPNLQELRFVSRNYRDNGPLFDGFDINTKALLGPKLLKLRRISCTQNGNLHGTPIFCESWWLNVPTITNLSISLLDYDGIAVTFGNVLMNGPRGINPHIKTLSIRAKPLTVEAFQRIVYCYPNVTSCTLNCYSRRNMQIRGHPADFAEIAEVLWPWSFQLQKLHIKIQPNVLPDKAVEEKDKDFEALECTIVDKFGHSRYDEVKDMIFKIDQMIITRNARGVPSILDCC